MAVRKSGPVKPPTLDMQPKKRAQTNKQAQSKPGATSQTSNEPAAATARESDTQTTQAQSKSAKPDLRALFTIGIAAAIGGAVIAVISIMALATNGTLGAMMPSQTEAQQITNLETRIGLNEEQTREGLVGFRALDGNVTRLADQTATDIDILDIGIATLAEQQTDISQNLARLQTRLSTQETALATQIDVAPATPTPIDLSPLQTQIDLLSARFDALGSGANSETSQLIADQLVALRSQQDNVQTELTALHAAVTALQQNLSTDAEAADTLRSGLDQLRAEFAQIPAPSTSPSAPFQSLETSGLPLALLQLPLALDGLQAAINSGRPFSQELANISALVPDLPISASISEIAGIGLPHPDDLARQLTAGLPTIYAARPSNPNASWVDNILARVKAVVAWRDSASTDPGSIDAVITRMERAVDQKDFQAASAAMRALPTSMQDASGKLATHLELAADVQALMDMARESALRGANNIADGTDSETTL